MCILKKNNLYLNCNKENIIKTKWDTITLWRMVKIETIGIFMYNQGFWRKQELSYTSSGSINGITIGKLGISYRSWMYAYPAI